MLLLCVFLAQGNVDEKDKVLALIRGFCFMETKGQRDNNVQDGFR